MKILGTIALSLVAIAASVVLLFSSMCAFNSGISSSDRLSFTLCALIALAVIAAAIWGNARLNRKT